MRADTVQRVKAALSEFGYVRSELDSRIIARPARVEVLMPLGDRNFFMELRDLMEQRFAAQAGRLIVRWTEVPRLDAKSLLSAIAKIDLTSDCVMMVGVDDHQVTDAIDLLVARGIKVLTFVADVPRSRRAAHVGLNNFSCGRLAASLMLRFVGQRPGSIQILAGSPMLRDQIDRVSGFTQLVHTESNSRPVSVRYEDWDGPAGNEDFVRKLLTQTADLVGIYVAGGSNRRVMQELEQSGQKNLAVIGHEFTQVTRAALVSGSFDAIIALDTDEMARRLIELAQRNGGEMVRPLEARIIMRENLPPIDPRLRAGA